MRQFENFSYNQIFRAFFLKLSLMLSRVGAHGRETGFRDLDRLGHVFLNVKLAAQSWQIGILPTKCDDALFSLDCTLWIPAPYQSTG